MVHGSGRYRLGFDRLGRAGAGGRAATAANFQGGEGRGLAEGQESAEADAAVPVEHAGQRAAGNAAQCWARDGGDRRGGRVDLRGQGRCGGACAPVHLLLAAPPSQARIHTEIWESRKTASARKPGSNPDPTGSGRGAVARTRSGSSIPRVRARTPNGYGRWTRIWLRHSTGSIMITCSALSADSQPGAGRTG